MFYIILFIVIYSLLLYFGVIRVVWVCLYRLNICDTDELTSSEKYDIIIRLPSISYMVFCQPFKFRWPEYY